MNINKDNLNIDSKEEYINTLIKKYNDLHSSYKTLKQKYNDLRNSNTPKDGFDTIFKFDIEVSFESFIFDETRNIGSLKIPMIIFADDYIKLQDIVNEMVTQIVLCKCKTRDKHINTNYIEIKINKVEEIIL